ncbi:hypothetical protein [Terasakiella pusilla]|uniref:hypothetical protein n=1 Tax=Terasakiella pusilla TaxID=64973 RepID=UPI003AA81D62
MLNSLEKHKNKLLEDLYQLIIDKVDPATEFTDAQPLLEGLFPEAEPAVLSTQEVHYIFQHSLDLIQIYRTDEGKAMLCLTPPDKSHTIAELVPLLQELKHRLEKTD